MLQFFVFLLQQSYSFLKWCNGRYGGGLAGFSYTSYIYLYKKTLIFYLFFVPNIYIEFSKWCNWCNWCNNCLFLADCSPAAKPLFFRPFLLALTGYIAAMPFSLCINGIA